MGKKKLVCMALVLAALVCGMMLAGCDPEMVESKPQGAIRVFNNSDNEYWVKNPKEDAFEDIIDLNAKGYRGAAIQFTLYEEGYYTIYYCLQLEGESQNDLDDRIWSSKSCYVTFDETTEVYIP